MITVSRSLMRRSDQRRVKSLKKTREEKGSRVVEGGVVKDRGRAAGGLRFSTQQMCARRRREREYGSETRIEVDLSTRSKISSFRKTCCDLSRKIEGESRWTSRAQGGKSRGDGEFEREKVVRMRLLRHNPYTGRILKQDPRENNERRIVDCTKRMVMKRRRRRWMGKSDRAGCFATRRVWYQP